MNAPLLLLHGFAGGPDSFFSLQASKGRTSLAPYLSGHGDLDPSVWARTFDEELERIAALVRERAGGPVRLLGYSLGARVGLGLLVRAPELVRQATLIGVNPGLRTDGERSARREADSRLIRLLQREGIERFVATWETQAIFASQGRLPADLRDRQRRIRLGHASAGLVHALEVLGLAEMPDFWPFLPTLDRPVTLVVGAEDQKFQKLAREMHALATHFSVVVAPGCGHNVVLEAPDFVGRIVESGSEFS
jgi:2-succinyl-6-hydroxy-2,4-cyclohexadiene-1-carboxylate synthase